MPDVPPHLDSARSGDRQVADDLLPLVYDELRRLAAARMSSEAPGHSLDATALVHEAYLKLTTTSFDSRSGFFRAAATAMQRILVDNARAKRAEKRGGGGKRVELNEGDHVAAFDPDTTLAINEALESLALEDAGAAEVARLRLFAGMTIEEAGDALGVSRAAAFRDWAYARAVLTTAMLPE